MSINQDKQVTGGINQADERDEERRTKGEGLEVQVLVRCEIILPKASLSPEVTHDVLTRHHRHLGVR